MIAVKAIVLLLRRIEARKFSALFVKKNIMNCLASPTLDVEESGNYCNL